MKERSQGWLVSYKVHEPSPGFHLREQQTFLLGLRCRALGNQQRSCLCLMFLMGSASQLIFTCLFCSLLHLTTSTLVTRSFLSAFVLNVCFTWRKQWGLNTSDMPFSDWLGSRKRHHSCPLKRLCGFSLLI